MNDIKDYQSVEPAVAVERYLDDRRTELAEGTLNAHRSRLRLFVRWCDEEGIESMTDVSIRHVSDFKSWRQQGVRKDGISGETLRSSLLTLRVFLRFCARIEAVDSQLPELIELPVRARRSRTVMLDADDAEALLDYLSTYRWASAEHVIIRLFWRSGMRAGSIRALDVDDVDFTERVIDIRHRPSTDTTLKNAVAGERVVNIDRRTVDVLRDWVDEKRPEVVDKHGREPLIATDRGRRSRQSLRRVCYYWTSPCRWTECPHGRDPEVCDAARWDSASECPSSVSPHPIRRGAITHHAREGWPLPLLSDKVDCSISTLREHYDNTTEEERAQIRREYMDRI